MGDRSNGDNGDHRWENVANRLRSEIINGQRRPGSQLPPSTVLARDHRVSRQTIQTAVDRLRTEGLISTRSGIGWFVANSAAVQLLRSSVHWSDRHGRPAGELSNGWRPQVELRTHLVAASDRVAADLGVSVGTQLCLRERRIVNHGHVLQLGHTFLPREITRGSTEMETAAPLPDRGTYAWLRGAGHHLVGFTEKVSATLATADEAERLGLPARRPPVVVRITRIAHGARRRLEVDYLIACANQLQLVYELPGHSGSPPP